MCSDFPDLFAGKPAPTVNEFPWRNAITCGSEPARDSYLMVTTTARDRNPIPRLEVPTAVVSR